MLNKIKTCKHQFESFLSEKLACTLPVMTEKYNIKYQNISVYKRIFLAYMKNSCSKKKVDELLILQKFQENLQST